MITNCSQPLFHHILSWMPVCISCHLIQHLAGKWKKACLLNLHYLNQTMNNKCLSNLGAGVFTHFGMSKDRWFSSVCSVPPTYPVPRRQVNRRASRISHAAFILFLTQFSQNTTCRYTGSGRFRSTECYQRVFRPILSIFTPKDRRIALTLHFWNLHYAKASGLC